MSKKSFKTLYYANSTSITQKNFINALIRAGVEKGDTIIVHSDIGTFGKLGTQGKNFLLQSLIDALKESVGKNGTIIMPTFTFCFFKDMPFDVNNTKSTVGVLTEYFRNLKNVSRTVHPTHSVAIWGKNKKKLLKIGKATFNKNSIFGKFHKLNGKIVFLGAPFQSCTFIHYIERIYKVPYRYKRDLKCKIINNKKNFIDKFLFYYRYLVFFNSMSRFENYLTKKGFLKIIKVGEGDVMLIESDNIFNNGYKLLDKDIFF